MPYNNFVAETKSVSQAKDSNHTESITETLSAIHAASK